MIELIFLIFGIIAFISAIYMLIGEARFHRRYRKEMKNKSLYSPEVSIIIPIKGIDHELENNIKAIIKQNYPNRVQHIFVLDSKHDPAFPIVNKIKKQNAKIVITKKLDKCSGKISALLTGLRHAEHEILVFADSDIRPKNDWLERLVGKLESSNMSSGVRFYPPFNTFLSYIISSWNSISLPHMFGRRTFPWGGSMAIRKKDFTNLSIENVWKKSLSDDLVIPALLKKNNMKLQFAAGCAPFIYTKIKFREFMEFSNRQMIILNAYMPKTNRLVLFAIGGKCFFVILGVIAFPMSYLLPAILLLSIIPLQMLQGFLAFRNYSRNLSIKGSAMKYAIASFIAIWILAYNAFQATRRNRINWRGKTYLIKNASTIDIKESYANYTYFS